MVDNVRMGTSGLAKIVPVFVMAFGVIVLGVTAAGALEKPLGAPVTVTANVEEDGGSRAPVSGEFDDEFDDDIDNDAVSLSDPIEPLNRGIFWVNDKLYFFLFKPVARVLRAVPEPVRTSVSNFFNNLGTPVRFANCVLQGKGTDAGNELGRFLANTIVGIGGLFDPAKKMTGIGPKQEDFGQTLGSYGVGPGFYIVLPVFGPSTLRDGVGRVVDSYADPLSYLSEIDVEDDRTVAVAAKIVDMEVWLSLDKDTYEGIKRDSLDPYLFMRNAYAQRREGQIRK